MVQQFRACTVLAEGSSLVPSTHIQQIQLLLTQAAEDLLPSSGVHEKLHSHKQVPPHTEKYNQKLK